MNNVMKNAEASIVKWCVDAIADMKAEGLVQDMEYVEIDARVELKDSELPSSDILGVTQFAITDQEKFFPIHFMLAISTLGDVNLFRLREISNWVYNRMQTGLELIYYDADNATARSWIKILPGTTVIPTSRVETRPFRFIQVSALLDPLQAARSAPDLAP